jgi:hypothetical protein
MNFLLLVSKMFTRKCLPTKLQAMVSVHISIATTKRDHSLVMQVLEI